MRLWLVTVDDDDWDYDELVEAAVWADSAEDAEARLRAAERKDSPHSGDSYPGPWVKPEWRLHTRPAPTDGIVLAHWHAG